MIGSLPRTIVPPKRLRKSRAPKNYFDGKAILMLDPPGESVGDNRPLINRHIFIDIRPRFGYICNASRSPIGRPPGDAGGWGECGSRGGGSSLPFSGGSGKTPGRHDDRPARSSLDWDRKERVTPVEPRTVFRTIGIVRADQVPGSACWS